MMSLSLFLNLLFIGKSYQFIGQTKSLSSHYATSLHAVKLETSAALFPTKEGDALTFRVAKTSELPRCAGFLSFNMYPESVPKGQQRELQRLELGDLQARYGDAYLSMPRSPAVFLVALEEEEIIASVGLDCQYYDEVKQKFKQIKQVKSGAVDEKRTIIPVISNLAVRRDRRKQGIAKKLMLACEAYIKAQENW
eukprot:CAMPEP_0119054012 /NCGR_PEP_ID=MMETSP1177-20130426/74794_1 /TAXON_ID=2985 /ORGANISM="Ochromonas sp, Strain CCMP1899" /LENGTH=194 /DNA_ID=CAMNT_0007034119 /DNA_START=51 /DNA_END=632 /DNA_ORIENTATION=+